MFRDAHVLHAEWVYWSTMVAVCESRHICYSALPNGLAAHWQGAGL